MTKIYQHRSTGCGNQAIVIMPMTIFIILSSWQCHCQSSSSSFWL